MRLIFTIFTFLLTFNFLFAQNTVILMNGQIMQVNSIKETDGMIVIESPKRFSKKIKATELNKSEIFSYIQNGKETVLYVQDSAFGDIYSVNEMRMYLQGERDSRKNFKGNHIAIIGYIICGAASFIVGDGLKF